MIDVSEMQFGFMPRVVIIDAIFIMCNLQKKYLRKKKKTFTLLL